MWNLSPKIILKKRIGESLIEVVAAMMIVVISISLAVTLLLNSTDTTNLNRNYLIAENLANEGVEAMTNMIYANLLKYGKENLEDCFLTYQTNSQGDPFLAEDCSENLILDPISNRLNVESILIRNYENYDLHWDFDRQTEGTLDLENNREASRPFRLYQKTLDNNVSIYINSTDPAEENASIYYRSAKLSIDPANPESVNLEAKVEWDDNSKINRIIKEATISVANLKNSSL